MKVLICELVNNVVRHDARHEKNEDAGGDKSSTSPRRDGFFYSRTETEHRCCLPTLMTASQITKNLDGVKVLIHPIHLLLYLILLQVALT